MGVCGYQENYDLYDMGKDELVNTGKSFREEHFCKPCQGDDERTRALKLHVNCPNIVADTREYLGLKWRKQGEKKKY